MRLVPITHLAYSTAILAMIDGQEVTVTPCMSHGFHEIEIRVAGSLQWRSTRCWGSERTAKIHAKARMAELVESARVVAWREVAA